jgi:hypothetical protein
LAAKSVIAGYTKKPSFAPQKSGFRPNLGGCGTAFMHGAMVLKRRESLRDLDHNS